MPGAPSCAESVLADVNTDSVPNVMTAVSEHTTLPHSGAVSVQSDVISDIPSIHCPTLVLCLYSNLIHMSEPISLPNTGAVSVDQVMESTSALTVDVVASIPCTISHSAGLLTRSSNEEPPCV